MTVMVEVKPSVADKFAPSFPFEDLCKILAVRYSALLRTLESFEKKICKNEKEGNKKLWQGRVEEGGLRSGKKRSV